MKLFDDQIPFMKPWVGDEEWQAMRDVISSGWVSQGPVVAEFEKVVAEYVGSRFAVAVNSCTSGMHLALRILGIKPGDEVLLPDSTCMANANAVMMAGAKPVFVDIDYQTGNLDPAVLEKYITPKTKALLGVDQVGIPAELDALAEITRSRGLHFVDDAATALGGKFKGKRLGGHGFPTTFSFHPRKTITTGEGGMLVSDDEALVNRARVLRSAGANVSDLVRHSAKGTIVQHYDEAGYNYRMTDMQAAMGIVQMKKIESILAQREKQARKYDKALLNVNHFVLPEIPDYIQPAHTSYFVKIHDDSPLTVTRIVDELASRGIASRHGIQPLHREPAFKNENYQDEMYPMTCKLAERSFFLPIYPGLPDASQDRIIDELLGIVKNQ